MGNAQTEATARYQSKHGYKVFSYKLTAEAAAIAEAFSQRCKAAGIAQGKLLVGLMQNWLNNGVNPSGVNPNTVEVNPSGVNPNTKKSRNPPKSKIIERAIHPDIAKHILGIEQKLTASEATQYLESLSLSVLDLSAIAENLSCYNAKTKTSKAKLIAAIVENVIGHKERTAAIHATPLG